MIKKTLLLIAAAVLLCPLAAHAQSKTYIPTPADLYDLDHYRHYEWGISDPLLSSGIVVTNATLSFSRIRNWDNNPNDLYVHLLDTSPVGVTVGWDGQGGGDEFASDGANANRRASPCRIQQSGWRYLPSSPACLLRRRRGRLDAVAAFPTGADGGLFDGRFSRRR